MRRVNRMPAPERRRRRPRTTRAIPIASPSPVIVPLALMLAELLAHHEALIVMLIQQGVLDGEELDRFCSRYTEEHLPGARKRIVHALKSALDDHDARQLSSLLSSSQYRDGW